jgi:hypothetical protein
VSTAIVRHEVSSIDDLQRVARLLATSNYFDAKAAGGDTAIAQIATKILAGAEMGYGPFASVQGIHVIQGKPVISANLMAAAVKRSGRYDYRVRRLDNEGCELEFFQRNADKLESIGKTAFTRDDAKAAGLLGKDNWSKFARNMYFARAMSNGIRFFCPDVFDGSAVYTPDELGADEDADGNVIDVQPTIIPQEVRPANKPAAPNAATISGGSQNVNGNGGGVAVEHTNGNGATVDAKTMARRYQEAKDAARKSGKFGADKHVDNAWGKMFQEYAAHDYANGEAFLAAWAEYVADHADAVKRGVEDVPAVADAEPVAV